MSQYVSRKKLIIILFFSNNFPMYLGYICDTSYQLKTIVTQSQIPHDTGSTTFYLLFFCHLTLFPYFTTHKKTFCTSISLSTSKRSSFLPVRDCNCMVFQIRFQRSRVIFLPELLSSSTLFCICVVALVSQFYSLELQSSCCLLFTLFLLLFSLYSH